MIESMESGSSHIGPGATVGRYQLLERLGQGAMAAVYRARDPELRREVAIKVLHAHLWHDVQLVERFKREARAVAALRHPHILEIYDYGTVQRDDEPGGEIGYLVVELVRGPTLREFLRSRGALLPEVAALVAHQLALALQAAHAHGVVHRDIKPDNVMIAEGGRLVLTDFGLARIVADEKVTQTGAVLGSPAYMSPEQAHGRPVDARSDLFSLGTLLYELASGSLPFSASDPVATVLRIVEGRYEPLARRNPRVGRSLQRVVERLLQTDPDQRFAEAGEVAEALAAVAGEVGIEDPDKEVARYFEAPGDYNRKLTEKIITRSLDRARTAASSGQFPAALSLCDRVLAFEPEHEDALELLEHLSARGRGRWRLWGSLVALAAGAAGTLVWLATVPAGDPPEATGASGRRPSARAGVSPGRASRGASDGRGPLRANASLARPTKAVAAREPDAGGRGAPTPRGAVRLDDAAVRRKVRASRRRPKRTAHRARHHRRRRDTGGSSAGSGKGATSTRPDEKSAATGPTVGAERAPRGDGHRTGSTSRPTGGGGSGARSAHAHAVRTAQLSVRIGPWCDLTVDGRSAGRSPLSRPLEVGPGAHRLVCRQGKRGPSLVRRVTVRAGEHKVISGLVVRRAAVTLQLARGDAVRIGDKTYRKGFSLRPSRYRVDLIRSGKAIEGAWVTIPPKGCRLVDRPRLRCASGPAR